MREIKFRAWDKKSKKMRVVNSIAFYNESENNLPKVINLWGYDPIEQKNIIVQREPKQVVLMQYTGLKDKNGKEIYEGDKIKFYYWSTYEQRSFPEYVDFRETEMKEGVGVVYWNETELSWYVRPIEGTTVYHRSERPVQLDEMPLVYAGLTMEAISDWVGEYDASEEDLKQYTGCDGIEVIGNIYQNHELLTNPPQPKE